jgi:hypothetical protein
MKVQGGNLNFLIKLSIELGKLVSNMLRRQSELKAEKNMKSLKYKNLISNFASQKKRTIIFLNKTKILILILNII